MLPSETDARTQLFGFYVPSESKNFQDANWKHLSESFIGKYPSQISSARTGKIWSRDHHDQIIFLATLRSCTLSLNHTMVYRDHTLFTANKNNSIPFLHTSILYTTSVSMPVLRCTAVYLRLIMNLLKAGLRLFDKILEICGSLNHSMVYSHEITPFPLNHTMVYCK